MSEDVPSSTEHQQEKGSKKFVILCPQFSPLQLNRKFLFQILVQFVEIKRSIALMSEIDYCVSRFHPTLPVLVCGFNRVFLLNADEDVSVPFSEWKEREISFEYGQGLKIITTLEWNVSFIFMPLKKRVKIIDFDSTF
jgi:hypothetical protein